MQVQEIDVDLYNYHPLGHTDKTDIIVRHEYIDNRHFHIHLDYHIPLDHLLVRKVEIEILIYYRKYQQKQIIAIDLLEKRITDSPNHCSFSYEVEVPDGIEIESAKKPVIVYPQYNLAPTPEDIRKCSLAEFNDRFYKNTYIYHALPTNIYAVGIREGIIYMYNEAFSSYFEIIEVIRFHVQILLTFFSEGRKNKTFAFLICADDGYMEGFYSSLGTMRYREKIADYSGASPEGQTKGPLSPPPAAYPAPEVLLSGASPPYRRIQPEALQENEYAMLHKAKWVLAMSNKLDVPYTIDVVDRHYFYCSLSHDFRSFHRGIPFQNKKNKIVYAGRLHNSSRFNFLRKRELTEGLTGDLTEGATPLGDLTQREYFYSDAVSKENVVAEKGKWIESREMVEYKYILDMDGNACTWDATAWKLNSGSVLMKVESGWRQWFYDSFHPWTHYVPIADDFSDLQEKYHWCETHPEECERMVSNAKDFFQEVYRFSNVVEYTRNALSRLFS
jgi:hypothetical protein